jgi:hypothetical protein
VDGIDDGDAGGEFVEVRAADKSVMKELTDNGLNEIGRKRMTPGWEPGGYLRRSANLISRVMSRRSSSLAKRQFFHTGWLRQLHIPGQQCFEGQAPSTPGAKSHPYEECLGPEAFLSSNL